MFAQIVPTDGACLPLPLAMELDKASPSSGHFMHSQALRDSLVDLPPAATYGISCTPHILIWLLHTTSGLESLKAWRSLQPHLPQQKQKNVPQGDPSPFPAGICPLPGGAHASLLSRAPPLSFRHIFLPSHPSREGGFAHPSVSREGALSFTTTLKGSEGSLPRRPPRQRVPSLSPPTPLIVISRRFLKSSSEV